MEYTVSELALLAGVSPRTLRYYDQIGLLAPARAEPSGYRVYGKKQVDLLQQILFYKRLGFGLADIKKALTAPSFSRLEALRRHLKRLNGEREELNLLIATLQKTILEEERGIFMSDAEKFEGLKKRLIEENEEKYGEEIRRKYGEEAVEQSNAKLMGLSPDQYAAMQELGSALAALLEQAVRSGASPLGEEGEKAYFMHKKWLSYTWPSYTPKAHAGLAAMYVADERFKAYYDANVPGCAQFLKTAVEARTAPMP